LRSALLAGIAVPLLLATSAVAAPRDPRLRGVHTWAFAIGSGDLRGNLIRRYAGYDLVVVDGQQASARQVRELRGAGKLVLAYLDVGTIEPGRPWYPAAKRYRLDYWPDWGEWYADLRARGYRTLIADSVAPRLLRKGFAGLFLDNTDMVETHPHQRGGMDALVGQLARLVHHRRALLFTQNGEASIGPDLRYYDGWNREDVTSTYDFGRHRYVRQAPGEIAAAMRALRRIGGAGLLTLATDYTAAADAGAQAQAVSNACTAGALPFVSDIDLTRVPAMPARCG
jgi:endo-alpha-1,4-polygalactosaminidase (GH114 family)